MNISLALHFDKGYIAHPYWPAREQLINHQKASGVNRVRSQERREKALKDYLESRHLTMDDYLALERQASEPFYRWQDVLLGSALDGKNPLEIVISAHQLYGCLAEACSMASTSLRIARNEQVRSVIQVSDFATGKLKADGVWSRFAVVKAGSGNRLSNQRSLREDPYLTDFDAVGTMHYLGEDERKLRDFLIWTGREVGVGASRKMGWGRFTLAEWQMV